MKIGGRVKTTKIVKKDPYQDVSLMSKYGSKNSKQNENFQSNLFDSCPHKAFKITKPKVGVVIYPYRQANLKFDNFVDWNTEYLLIWNLESSSKIQL